MGHDETIYPGCNAQEGFFSLLGQAKEVLRRWVGRAGCLSGENEVGAPSRTSGAVGKQMGKRV